MPQIVIHGKNCYYDDIGEGYPILFGHSYLWRRDMFRPQIEALSKEYRCIAPDLWSHGQSDPLSCDNYDLDTLAEDYWELMKQLGISKFAVIGLSVGGMWGARLAMNHPESVSHLALMGTYLGAEPVLTKMKYFTLLGILKQFGFTETILDQIVPLFFCPNTLKNKPEIVKDFRDSLASIPQSQIPGIVSMGKVIFSRKCLLKDLAKLEQPTIVITGRDDAPRPPTEAEKMDQVLPNSSIHIIENAGHISNLEQPDRITELLSSFLKEYAPTPT